ncbi:MAG: hypothetical protein RI883_2001 [Bacteroidota bacterium]|jgi:hypothetical protein
MKLFLKLLIIKLGGMGHKKGRLLSLTHIHEELKLKRSFQTKKYALMVM